MSSGGEPPLTYSYCGQCKREYDSGKRFHRHQQNDIDKGEGMCSECLDFVWCCIHGRAVQEAYRVEYYDSRGNPKAISEKKVCMNCLRSTFDYDEENRTFTSQRDGLVYEIGYDYDMGDYVFKKKGY